MVVPQSNGVIEGPGAGLLQDQRGTTMEQYAGIDVSLESASVCVVDTTVGSCVRESGE